MFDQVTDLLTYPTTTRSDHGEHMSRQDLDMPALPSKHSEARRGIAYGRKLAWTARVMRVSVTA